MTRGVVARWWRTLPLSPVEPPLPPPIRTTDWPVMSADDISAFEPLVGTVFDADAGGLTPVPLRLAAVQRLPEQRGAPRQQPFTLTFTGPADPQLAQRTYAVRHPRRGSLELFLVPVGPDDAGAPRYEAVFN